MERYLGIDLGEKRIGLAVSDPTLTIAQPLKTLEFTSMPKLVRDLQEVIETLGISKMIVGLPITLKGTYSQKTHQIVEMVEKLKQALGLPVELYDERLTTVQAQKTMQFLGKKPSRQKGQVDQLAAMHLLQNYLDQEKSRRKTNGA